MTFFSGTVTPSGPILRFQIHVICLCQIIFYFKLEFQLDLVHPWPYMDHVLCDWFTPSSNIISRFFHFESLIPRQLEHYST